MRRLRTVVVAGVSFLFSGLPGWFVGTETGVARAEEALKKAKIDKDDKALKKAKIDKDEKAEKKGKMDKDDKHGPGPKDPKGGKM